MLPIAVLPAAGLLLGIGGVFSNPHTVHMYPVLDVPFLQSLFILMRSAGQIVFANLSLLFCVGVAVGLAKSDKGTAGLASVLAFLIMNVTINAMLTINGTLASTNLKEVGQAMVLGIQTLQTGVLGGILCGLLVAVVHGRYYKVELHSLLAFFSGSRFVPIVASFASIFLGVLLYFCWPFIQSGISGLGVLVEKTGYAGTFAFGVILKLLLPLGLHHIFYMPFWYTSVGGEAVVNGHLVQGTQNIFFAQLADPNTVKYYEGVSRFMSGRFADFMFGLPGAALAMYHCVKPENRKKVAGILLSAAVTSFVTGITEPLEFLFLFTAPILYVFHVIGVGLAFMLCNIFNITVGMTFSGGVIDFTLFGILQGNAKTNYLMMFPVGAFMFTYYYIGFRVLITWKDLKTPGRGDDYESDVQDDAQDAGSDTPKLGTDDKIKGIIDAFGGRDNIIDLDCCATRLRVNVKDMSSVEDKAFKRYGAIASVIKSDGIQVIFGPQVTVIKNQLDEYMNR
ncbi:PTS system IIB component (Glc family) /PTS system IIC component (Glc family) [Celerinatantimonas diazotrophica]|uniref:PTS system IIB component (Glc family) /PTS system IIC component (Glc family) n=2 Tax=Celerinatantimonas diazotrophica TaxID=412034 RepID=A0A4R1K5E6_9GAMM|nr:PTS system IIB component (Glc family) /PTS system IIC component (Glc family) [Celerinatantimonas diazotrophica]CAG9297608.1 PTS system glucose-specific EIICBA component [Celerinatantimonas diazotrophica]